MVRSTTPEPAGGDQSLGDLVSLAAKDISQLVRYEIDLAKTELRGDMRRAGTAGVLFGIAAFFGCLILLSLCFAYAYLLHWAGAPGGLAGAFGFVALTLAVLAALAVFVASRKLRRMSGMKKTRRSVTEGLGMLRRDGKAAQDTRAQLADGQRPEIAEPASSRPAARVGGDGSRSQGGSGGTASPHRPGGPGGMASPQVRK